MKLADSTCSNSLFQPVNRSRPSVGLLGLIGLQARAVNFSVNAEDRNRAALFANDVASGMWLAGWSKRNTSGCSCVT